MKRLRVDLLTSCAKVLREATGFKPQFLVGLGQGGLVAAVLTLGIASLLYMPTRAKVPYFELCIMYVSCMYHVCIMYHVSWIHNSFYDGSNMERAFLIAIACKSSDWDKKLSYMPYF